MQRASRIYPEISKTVSQSGAAPEKAMLPDLRASEWNREKPVLKAGMVCGGQERSVANIRDTEAEKTTINSLWYPPPISHQELSLVKASQNPKDMGGDQSCGGWPIGKQRAIWEWGAVKLMVIRTKVNLFYCSFYSFFSN